LADEEATAVLNGVPNSRGELESKSVEKDVKTINSLIVKGSKWIKIHMIYKKLSQAGGAGEGFIVRMSATTHSNAHPQVTDHALID